MSFSDDCRSSLETIEALAAAADDAWPPAPSDDEIECLESAATEDYLASADAGSQERDNMLDRLALIVNAVDEFAAGEMSAGARYQLAQAMKNAEECLNDTRKMLERRLCEELVVGARIGDAEIVFSSSWNRVRWSELMPKVVALIADTPGVVWSAEGERLPGHVVAENLIDALHLCVGWSKPKRPGLAELGLDLDEYAERKAGPVVRWSKR